MNWLKNITDKLLPQGFQRSPEIYRKATLLIHSGFIILGVTFIYLPIFFVIGYTWGVIICLVGGISMSVLLSSAKFNPKLNIISNLAFLVTNLFFLSFVLTSGGVSSPLATWLISVPLLAFLVLEKRDGFLWGIVCTLEIIGLFVLEVWGYKFPIFYDDKWADLVRFVDFLGLILFMIAVILVYLEGREFVLEELQKTNEEVKSKNVELNQQKALIEKINREMKVQNNLLEVQHAEIKRMNQKLEDIVDERTKRLVKANEELDLFLYRASHDLRRPVTSLIGLFELARLEFGKPAGYELFNYMNTTASNMDKMLRKLIMISEVNHEYTHPSEIDMRAILEKVLGNFQKIIQEKNIEIISRVKCAIDFYSIPMLLEIILYNLIENAVAFLQENSETQSKIEITLETTEQNLLMEVKDNGIGIAEEHLPRLTRMFYRATLHSQGNGLGLYIVRKALERLEGNYEIISQLDKGTTVKVYLPIKTIKNLNLNVIV